MATVPLSPRNIVPTTGRRHFGDDAIARREEMELIRYQQQLEAVSRTVTPQISVTPKASPSTVSLTNIPNSIIAHYEEELTTDERAKKRAAAVALAAEQEASARALRSKLLEDRVREEQMAQAEIQKKRREEEIRREKELDAMMNSNAAAAVRLAKEHSHANKQKAREVGAYQIQTAEMTRLNATEQRQQERALDRQEADTIANQHKTESQLKKDYQRQVAMADQRLWDHQKTLQAAKNSPGKLLSPRQNLQMHVEKDQPVMAELEAYQRLQDSRAAEMQRQQEEKVFKQLALISATAEGTAKMVTPRQSHRLQAINTIGGSTGMIEKLDESDKARLARSEAMKRSDAHHQEEVMRSSTPRKMLQNGLYSHTTAPPLLASSSRTNDGAKTFESGSTLIDKLAGNNDAYVSRRKEFGRQVEGIQRLQADQRRLEDEVQKSLEKELRLRQDRERQEQDDTLKRQLDEMLLGHGISSTSPKASRLLPLESPRKNPGPGAFANYESRTSPLKR